MAQEQLRASGSQPPSGDTGATISAEARVHAQMSILAKQFLTLFDAIPRAGLVRQMSGKPSQGLVMSAANVYSGPSTGETLVLVAPPGTLVRVFAQVAGQAFPPGNVWYRISKPSEPPRYIYAGLVILGNLHQSLQRYFQLATQLWEAVAADRLEEVAHDTAYQAAVMTLEQQLERLQELCHNTKQDPHARGNWRWQRRVRLYRRALETWLRCLDEDPSAMLSNPTECGRVLYHAQGCLGLASCNGFDYVLIKSLHMLGVLVSLASFLFLVWYVGQLPTDGADSFLTKIVTLLVLLFIPVYLLWFSAIGTSLPVIMGYALTRQKVLDAAQVGSKASSQLSNPFQLFFRISVRLLYQLWEISPRLLRYWLRVWSILGGVVILYILYYSAIVYRPPDEQGLYLIVIDAAVCSIGCIVVYLFITFPFTLTMQAQMCGELIAHPQRPPKARRSAVRPAMKLLSLHTIIFLVIAFTVVNSVNPVIAPVSLGPIQFSSLHQVVYFLVVLLLYLLCLEFPYRWGLRHWKTCQLGELAALRKRFDRRLSQAPSPPAVEKESSSTQDDYARWQYYRAQEEDVKQTSPGLFSLVQQGWALLIAFASSFLFAVATELLKTKLGIPH